MPLAPGARLGPYEIQAPLGAGGMGEVYTATDTRLDRTVAIKVLPSELAADPERRERFEREAKTISSLSHPHICTLYEFDHEDGIDFLVMEHLEGETLADRLKKGALPLEQALRYAIEIADALDKAHRQGIVHRDLKPGNIMLTKAGAKLLDFGLAKLRKPGTVGAEGFSATTALVGPSTAKGVLLGTLQYMAPEQLGGEADARTDIWAFGCVVYEMVTGKTAFEGKSQASVIHAIMGADQPPRSRVEPTAPPGLDYVVNVCLSKDPDDRWQSSRDLLRELKRVESGDAPAVAPAPSATASERAGWQRPMVLTFAALLVGALVTGLGVWRLMRDGPSRVNRFVITAPPGTQFFTTVNQPDVAISPDGTQVVSGSVADDGMLQLSVRLLDQLETIPLPSRGSQPVGPFVSADGNWVGFFDDADDTLKKVSVLGGPPLTICQMDGNLRGATWGADDTIVFATQATGSGLWIVPAAGGEPEALTRPNVERGELGHQWPEILPGGEAVLFTIVMNGPIEEARIAVLNLETGEQKVLLSGGSNPRYTTTGHLIYGHARTLRAVGFDRDRLEVMTEPVTVVEDVVTKPQGGASFGISENGSLVYRPLGSVRRTLAWVDRDGHEEPLAAEPRSYTKPGVSPDGTRVALDVRDQEDDIWIWDFARETLTRLTFDPASDFYPVWTPDGQHVVFSSRRAGAANLYWKAADGTGGAERLTEGPNNQYPHSFSPDGTRLVFVENSPGELGFDLRVLTLGGGHQTEPLVVSEFHEENGEISPDGRWLAYQSQESGRYEIYVRPFPKVNDGRWQISTEGGTRPLWAPDGDELFYLASARSSAVSGTLTGGELIGVPVQTGSRFSAGRPDLVLEQQYSVGGSAGPSYDIAADGQRFLMIKDQADAATASTQIILVLNWFEELKRLVPNN